MRNSLHKAVSAARAESLSFNCCLKWYIVSSNASKIACKKKEYKFTLINIIIKYICKN